MIDRLCINFSANNNLSVGVMDLSAEKDFSVLSIAQKREGTELELICSYPLETTVNFSLSNSSPKSFTQFLNRHLLAGTYISTLKGTHHGQM